MPRGEAGAGPPGPRGAGKASQKTRRGGTCQREGLPWMRMKSVRDCCGMREDQGESGRKTSWKYQDGRGRWREMEKEQWERQRRIRKVCGIPVRHEGHHSPPCPWHASLAPSLRSPDVSYDGFHRALWAATVTQLEFAPEIKPMVDLRYIQALLRGTQQFVNYKAPPKCNVPLLPVTNKINKNLVIGYYL